VANGRLLGGCTDLSHERTQFLEDIVHSLDEPGAVADQAVAPYAVNRNGG
jgi:hypothetical protein